MSEAVEPASRRRRPVRRSIVWAGLLALVAPFGCGAEPLTVVAPPFPEARSVVLTVEAEDAIDAFALDPREGEPFRMSLGEGPAAQITALAYPRPLSRLGLRPGRLPVLAPSTVSGARIPETSSVSVAELRPGSRFEGWSRRSQMPSSVGSVRLAAPSAVECLAAGGCFAQLPVGSAPLCDYGCPPPLAPEPPAGPARPDPAGLPADWWVDPAGGFRPWSPDAAPCRPGELRTPHRPVCAPVRSCPEVGFGELSTIEEATFVDPAALVDGPGTAEAPTRKLETAQGGRFVLARGDYVVASAPSEPLELFGVCPDRVQIRWRAAAAPRGHWSGLRVELDRELTVSDPLRLTETAVRGSVRVASGGDLRAERVAWSGTLRVEAGASAALVDARVDHGGSRPHTVWVEGVAQLAGTAVTGPEPLAIRPTGTATLRRVHLAAEGDRVLDVLGRLEAHVLSIDGRAAADGAVVGPTGQADLDLAAVTETAELGVAALGGDVLAEDLFLRPAPDAQADFGTGLWVGADGTLIVRRARVEHAFGIGVHVLDRGSRAELEDLAILDTQAGRFLTPSARGVGLRVSNACFAILRRVRIAGARQAGVEVRNRSAEIDGEDVLIEDILGRLSGKDGMGLHVYDKGLVQLRRAEVRRAKSVGVLVEDALSSFDASDLRIADTVPNPDSCTGSNCNFGVSGGVLVERVATAALRKFHVLSNTGYGIGVGSESVVRLSDGLIRDHQRGIVISNDGIDARELVVRVRVDEALEPFADLNR